MSVKIKKAGGQIEEFNEKKLLHSLIRAGAEKEHAREVVNEIVSQIKPHMSTRKIYRLAHRYLKHYNRATVLRYSLKDALLRLGPSGYPFEKYVGELLRSSGYDVKVGVILEGRCVTHEVDVYAENNEEIVLVECKYRNSSEGAHDVKTALYVYARHQDLRTAMEKQYRDKEINGWLVTNTRFTDDAIQFAECSGMTIVSWGYPKKMSLEKMIEESRLYPVTVLSGLTSQQVRKLIEQNMFLMKDLAKKDTASIGKLLSITDRKASQLKHQAEELCFC
jgi:Holliday junction resolvase-like predicted endonuclease